MLNTQTEKLKKLLELTTSTNDHEALAAIRKANEILKNNGKTWSTTFGADSVEADGKYEQLHLKFNALTNDYKNLIDKYNKLITHRQTVVIPTISPRRRTNRL